ncbi:ABC transporter permease [Microlunatus capsulatus]|uniref:Oligopeptide transport system permease protein n=1 Tax=Microlunatus capsulatus TaxID=99117 RepID=A0ABS4ZAX9_9ACTN|nr:ABC transporter permease [Microlunatus capsulatus]MBP2418201.1 oligopeptide transport system permease protein [Microlunatus capsulatus]
MTDVSVSGAGGPAQEAAAVQPGGAVRGRSLWASAWGELRRNPLFWVAAALILVFVVMAVVPQVFTSTDPTSADLNRAREKPSLGGGLFGYDSQGYDVYARTIHGARASILVGVLSTLATTLLGGAVGLVAGYRGGWLDALLQRVGEIFFALPLLLGGILFLFTFPNDLDTPLILQVLKIVAFIALLGWPNIARLMRSSVLQVKPNDYVQAARALGASNGRIIFRHILPNALAPVIIVSTINLGVYIAAEATLSFLGIGLQPPAISWGTAISDASAIGLIRVAPHMLLFPSIFLSLTVLAFIMLGDAVRDALDPKLR